MLAVEPAEVCRAALFRLSDDAVRWSVAVVVATRMRHCERSEAILAAARRRGLLRRSAPRNDGDGST